MFEIPIMVHNVHPSLPKRVTLQVLRLNALTPRRAHSVLFQQNKFQLICNVGLERFTYSSGLIRELKHEALALDFKG